MRIKTRVRWMLLALLCVAASAQGLDPTGAMLLMGAMLVVSAVLAPLAAAAAIRIAQG